MGIFLAGFAEIDITPPPGCELTGYGPGRIATGVNDPLKAVAVVLDDRRQKSILCVADLCVIHEDVVKVVQARVKKRTAIPVDRILIAATHTHSAPKLMNSDMLENQRWVRELEDKLTKVMMLADYHRVPATVSIGSGMVEGIGANRRIKDGPADHSVSVLRVDGVREGRPLGAIVNVACHPTVLGPDNREYSADFIGQLRETVRKLHGSDLPVACFNGACGDVNPGGYSAEASMRGEKVGNRTFERAKEIGQAMGKVAYNAFTSASLQDDPQVQAERRPFNVTLKPHPLPAEAKQKHQAALDHLKQQQEGTEAWKQAKTEATYAATIAENAVKYAICPDGKMDLAVQGFSVADWVIVSFPTEIMAKHGLRLKKHSGFAQTMIAAYANASLGYLPDEAPEEQGGYEQRVALFGPWAVETVIGFAENLVGDLWQRQQARKQPAAPVAVAVEVKPELPPDETPVTKACVPAIDFHLHWWTYWHTFDEVLERMDKADIRYGVNLVGDVFPGCEIDPIVELMKPVSDRFFYFTAPSFKNIDSPDWPKYVRRKLERDRELGARGIKLYKDLGLAYQDSTGRLLRPTDPRVKPLWDIAAEFDWPVLFHVADPPAFFEKTVEPWNERYGALQSAPNWWWGKPGFPEFDELIEDMFVLARQNPKTNFVFPHVASLDNDLPRCGELIRSSDNIYVDLSARLPQLVRQPHKAHEFCVKHADRVIFGTDDSLPGRNGVYELWIRCLETWDEYFPGDYYGARQPWRFYGLGLPKNALQKIYWDNAARLLKLDSQAQLKAAPSKKEVSVS